MLPDRVGMCAAQAVGAGLVIQLNLSGRIDTGGAEHETWDIIFSGPYYAGGVGF